MNPLEEIKNLKETIISVRREAPDKMLSEAEAEGLSEEAKEKLYWLYEQLELICCSKLFNGSKVVRRKQADLTFKEFSKANLERCEAPDGFNHSLSSWSHSDWLTATVGELGEAANVIKKLNRVRDGIPGNSETESQLREALRRELADTFIYFDLLCQSSGLRVDDIVTEKFDETSKKMNYPRRLNSDEI